MSLVNNIEQASSKLGEDNPFVNYNINFTNEEVQVLKDFTLNIPLFRSENYYDYFEANSTAEISKISNSFLRFLNHVSSSKEYTDVVVKLMERIFLAASYNNNPDEITLLDFRVTSPSKGYNIDTTWHIDYIFSSCMHRNFITFKGPPTLFYNDKSVKEQIFNQDSAENTYSQQLIDPAKIDRPALGQGTVFIQGGDNAALHAGTDRTDEDRLVMILDKCNLIAEPGILENRQESILSGNYNYPWNTETTFNNS